MEICIRKIGNSKGAVFPAPLIKELGVDSGEILQANVVDGRLVIEKMNKPEYSLDELLVKCEPSAMALDEDAIQWLNSAPVGKELI
ncbi:AbrB family transcriptional regulator [Paraglaciecola sp. MB-3u-78]|jgi:antitoxin ChpS|uniref:AbrB/MazE/SpoVT family DNA-binding domain-containing protein n=1 Tax=Paraglaciecola sp. MB-3u-78 TaxID=2058332 RepID=UPI000C32A21D|nr:AbrB family transcriptional regulator [Paraglaciecola sp. MB-3u-78]PKH00414.1 AbrB family transcriptional regulator [Paraglaciecola sp. MB-3u-78]